MKKITSLSPLLFITFFSFSQTQIGNDITGIIPGELTGSAVSLSADGFRIAVGAPGTNPLGLLGGQARVYQLENDEWVQLGHDLQGDAAGDKFGTSISLSADGQRVAVGAPSNNGDNGQVQVFEYNGGDWVLLGNEIMENAPFGANRWGDVVALSSDGARILIGAPWTTGGPIGAFAGYAAVYEFNGTDWEPLGNGIQGENDSDFSGYSAAISADGSRILVGAQRYDDQLEEVGYVRIFDYNGTDWVQVGNSIIGNTAKEQSGWSAALSADGNRVAISAPFNGEAGENAGQLRVYDFDGTDWVQVGSSINGQAGELSGWKIAMSPAGNRVALGAQFSNSGIVRLYEYDGNDWGFLGDITGEVDGNAMGSAISFSENGEWVAVGAPQYSTNYNGDGLVRVYGDLILNDGLLNQQKNKINIYPNPTDGNIFIKNNLPDYFVQITDPAGKIVFNDFAENNIDISFLPKGLYFLTIKNENIFFTEKIIKN